MVIDVTVIGCVVGGIDPMPLVAECAFGCVGVVVCPGRCETDAFVVLRFEYLVENRPRGGS